MQWQLEGDRPIYQQLVDQIMMQIVSGQRKAGDKVPAVRELAAEAGVNPNTMQRALADLERQGLLYTNRTSGRYVTEDEEMITKIRERIAEERICAFLESMSQLGFTQEQGLEDFDWFAPRYGSILAEVEGDCGGVLLGKTTYAPMLEVVDAYLSLADLQDIWETTLEEVYPTQADTGLKDSDMADIFCSERSPLVATEKFAHPRAVIPVFPGTNCEYDTANACLQAGIEPEIVVVRNLDPQVLRQSADELAAAIGRSQMMILPGGFSGGDEPDGSAKFIVSFLRNPKLTDAVHDLLKNRDGLMLGICNGFQALVKLGLVPYGEIRQTDDTCPTLTFNLIGRHQSRYVTTRVASVKSPWMLLSQLDDMHTIPVSHGEGRFVAPEAILTQMIENGQIATQYTDTASIPSLHISANPNGSVESIEGIFSPDGRVFGKMGHSERQGKWIAKNIPGNKHQPIFESGALYYK